VVFLSNSQSVSVPNPHESVSSNAYVQKNLVNIFVAMCHRLTAGMRIVNKQL